MCYTYSSRTVTRSVQPVWCVPLRGAVRCRNTARLLLLLGHSACDRSTPQRCIVHINKDHKPSTTPYSAACEDIIQGDESDSLQGSSKRTSVGAHTCVKNETIRWLAHTHITCKNCVRCRKAQACKIDSTVVSVVRCDSHAPSFPIVPTQISSIHKLEAIVYTGFRRSNPSVQSWNKPFSVHVNYEARVNLVNVMPD